MRDSDAIIMVCAPIAQLDRASGYEPGGRTFESCWAHQNFTRSIDAERNCNQRIVYDVSGRHNQSARLAMTARTDIRTATCSASVSGEERRLHDGHRLAAEHDPISGKAQADDASSWRGLVGGHLCLPHLCVAIRS